MTKISRNAKGDCSVSYINPTTHHRSIQVFRTLSKARKFLASLKSKVGTGAHKTTVPSYVCMTSKGDGIVNSVDATTFHRQCRIFCTLSGIGSFPAMAKGRVAPTATNAARPTILSASGSEV